MKKVYFYLNENDYGKVKDLKTIEPFTLSHPQLVWSWGTYFRLKQKGFDVELTYKIPDEGIVVMPAIYPAMLQKPPEKVLFVCTVADSPPPFYMQVLIQQNVMQASQYPNIFKLPIWHHIPHWPQPGLIARDDARGNKFENVIFFGHRDQLDSSLTNSEFQNELKNLGLNFIIRDKEFHDFSDADVVIAIRSFSNEPFYYKPYTKLVNSWMAKTPVIAGAESSFQSIRKSELDFLVATSKDQLLQAILKLKQNDLLRQKMVANGLERMKEFTDESVTKAWSDFLFNDAQGYQQAWARKSTLSKNLFYLDVFASRGYRSLKNKLARS